MKSFVILVCVALYGLADCQESIVSPCPETDTDCFKGTIEDILLAIADGIPDMNIPSMDPLHVEQMKASKAGLDMNFKNTKVTGFRDCEALDLRQSGRKGYFDLKCSMNLDGDYTLGGQVLFMPLVNSGTYNIKIRDIVVKIKFEIADKMVNGEKYWTLKSWNYSYDLPKDVHFQFNNLFNGNSWISTAVHYVANENWRPIFQDASPAIVQAIIPRFLYEISKVLDHIPVADFIEE